MKRGPKALPDRQKLVRGTFQRARSHPPIVPTIPGDPIPPKWLKGEALKIWRGRVETYRARGQAVKGCEGVLAQYVAMEADIADKRRRRIEVPVALLNAFRVYANEFYDTPASQVSSKKEAKAGNTFARNGRPFAPAGRA